MVTEHQMAQVVGLTTQKDNRASVAELIQLPFLPTEEETRILTLMWTARWISMQEERLLLLIHGGLQQAAQQCHL